MAHISLSPPKGSTTFSPLTPVFERDSKDGKIPVINFLIGSHFNASMGNELTPDATGDIAADSIAVISGKLEIAATATSGSITKIANFSTFMYFYPGIKMVGHLELFEPTHATKVEKVQWTFTDLATDDDFRIVMVTGVINPTLSLEVKVAGVDTTLVTIQLGVTTKEVYIEIDYLDEGITKVSYIDKTVNGPKTTIFKGTLQSDMAEAKVSAILTTDSSTSITVKSDFLWIFYPKLFVSYEVDLANRLKGRLRLFDTVITGDADETNWIEAYSSDHEFKGDRVIENGITRLWFRPATPSMEVWTWKQSTSTYLLIGEVAPKNTQGVLASNLEDVIIERFNNAQCVIVAKYGIVEHKISLRRGMPSCRISTSSKSFRFNTDKQNVAINVANVGTDILHFNQATSNDSGQGNPLDTNVLENPFIFTDDNDADNGLDRINDNWWGFYGNGGALGSVGFVGLAERPTSAEIHAINATTLSHITWGFPNNAIVCVGGLIGSSVLADEINNILPIFHVGNDDTYVKYRANEGIFSFNQRMVLRKKR